MARPQRTKTLDDSTFASDPGGLELSVDLARHFHPELYAREHLLARLSEAARRKKRMRTHLSEHLRHGDARAAVVVSVDPVLIAAYTDEFDCVAMLRFSSDVVDRFGIRIGTRLLTVNTYACRDAMAADLELGPEAIDRWVNFAPYIADFLTEETARLDVRKSWISEDEWERAAAMAARYLQDHPGRARDGRPLYCMRPAT